MRRVALAAAAAALLIFTLLAGATAPASAATHRPQLAPDLASGLLAACGGDDVCTGEAPGGAGAKL